MSRQQIDNGLPARHLSWQGKEEKREMGNNDNKNNIRGFKVFNPDWTCRGFQYEVGKVYEMDEEPECCGRGFHFCLYVADCFNYYNFSPENKVAEIIAFGEVDAKKDDGKYCTNKIQIVREIHWDELLRIVNTGKNCTGRYNSGNRNSGDRNSGDRNSGDWNSGNRNSGDWNSGNRNSEDYNSGNRNSGNYNSGDRNSGNRNSGNYNSGDYNSGNYNSGNYNSGDYNSGNRNSGDWNSGNYNSGDYNKSSFNTGCFMTEEQKIHMFNKPSEWTYLDWLNSDAREILSKMPNNTVDWICSEDMTEEEKEGHPEHETTGGCLKAIDEFKGRQPWWDALPDEWKEKVRSLPNFDPEIFEQCTGIREGIGKGTANMKRMVENAKASTII